MPLFKKKLVQWIIHAEEAREMAKKSQTIDLRYELMAINALIKDAASENKNRIQKCVIGDFSEVAKILRERGYSVSQNFSSQYEDKWTITW